MTTGSKKQLPGTKEFDDDMRCPICMDHPHNAVLLLCSSQDNGCRCYVCDTSYRHSNCLDRFKKGIKGSGDDDSDDDPQRPLKCPLCRGDVVGWRVVEQARQCLDKKVRSCSRESCTFTGNYGELRQHARRAHPFTRPGAVDPARRRAWRRIERRQEYGDVLSAIRSAIPGAIVVGDYVIETGTGTGTGTGVGDDSRVSRGRERDDSLWSPYMLFNMRRLPPVREEEDNFSRRRRRRRFVRSRSEEENS